ncbi:MAG TPA: GMC family oxidoreductase N-terminal domain-containing protein [Solirubrobacterales bacterium]|nr:GMC family oxidoreductase N-terminal domain-containing protein [Solirubrobacterales bacterium]
MPDKGDATSCDYLVIGGGSGGCAVAGRLAAEGAGSVILIESGGTNRRPDVDQPDKWFDLLVADTNWNYETVPQPAADDRVHIWAMGKVLGGSSSTNGMMYMRGAPWDYDEWASEGNPGWESEKVYSVFKEMESYPEGTSDVRGTEGPIKVTTVDGKNPLTAAFLVACEECGIPRTPDFNGLDPEGADVQQLNVWEGRRQSSAVIFVEPQVEAGNLEVLLDTTAEQLIFEPGTQRVTGVRIDQGGKKGTIEVRGEVIVSSGSIGSPQLLLLSGIGPADELRKLGIEVAIDLPGVGNNLHDHIGVPVPFETKVAYPPSEFQRVEANAYCKSEPGDEHYNVQIPFQLFPFIPPNFGGYEFETGYTFYPGLLKPKSRGKLSLKSSDPGDPPVIDPAYLQDEDDVRRLVLAVNIAREIGGSAAFDEWRKREALPGEGVHDTAEIEKYVRSAAATYWHPAGTCRMGPGPDCVVGADLKVHGAENLRVADASVMPTVPSGNTNVPSMMIGWRAAGFIAG